jgi:hypothetical protein
MPALNFKSQFADLVRSFKKRQTIRANRINEIRPGDMLYFYTGQRTKQCQQLGFAHCKKVSNIRIGRMYVIIDENYIDDYTANKLAQKDGFKNLFEMVEWFENIHGLPFKGKLIEW